MSIYLSETGEPLAGVLCPGNAGANTAADHFEVLALALEQLPEADLHREILARADIAGRTHAFISDCRDAGIRFSVGYEVEERVRRAILSLPESAWQQAIDAEGKEREGAQVIELSDHVDLSSWPEGTRLIVRRERPYPGAQFQVFDANGYRHTAFITDQDETGIAALELHHRRRARVEDSIRIAKETGMRGMPFAAFEHNQAWLEISLLAQAILHWSALLCLEGDLALAEPKRIRQRCCTSPGGSCARHGARRCGYRTLGPGPRPWWRPSGDCGRCQSLRARSDNVRSQPRRRSSPPPISPCSQTGGDAPIRRRPISKGTPGRFHGTAPASLPISSQPITPCRAKTVDRG